MTEKDFNQVIMSFFHDNTVRAFSTMYGEFKKIGRTIELQAILNELIKIGMIEKTKTENYKQTKKLQELLDNTGLSYGGQPYSYYLSKKRIKFKIDWNIVNIIIAILAIIVSIILAVML